MFLDQILMFKQVELQERMKAKPLADLEKELEHLPPPRSFRDSLSGGPIRLIAEIKKASPSKGLLCPDFHPDVLARIYENAGAAALSVLTEEKYFQGSLADLRLVKASTFNTPLLRKDFITATYQLIEARVSGADAVLLIVAALTIPQLRELIRQARDFDLDPLVEVHNENELETALEAGAGIIGINNRDLHTFTVDLNTTFTLLPLIPKDLVVVSESGIRSSAEVRRLAEAGVNGVLIGETLVTAADPGAKIRELLGAVQ